MYITIMNRLQKETLMDKIADKIPQIPDKSHNVLKWILIIGFAIAVILLFIFGEPNPNAPPKSYIAQTVIFGIRRAIFGY